MELKIKEIKVDEFKHFVKKLLAIDKYVFIKMNNKTINSTVYLPQKDAVKLVSFEVPDVFELEQPLDDMLRISFYEGPKIIESLSYFDKNVQGKITYSQMDGEEGYFASDFMIYDKKLSIKLSCADPALTFIDMPKDDIKRAFNRDNAVFKFKLRIDDLSKMISLFKLDKAEKDTFKLKFKDKVINLVGNNYDTILSERGETLDDELNEVTVYKKYIPLLDKENYEVEICTNKIFLRSLDTNTLLTIALCASVEDDTDFDDIEI